MVTPRNKLVRKLQGHVYHLTSTKGLRGIMKDGQIFPNLDGRLAHSSIGSIPGCYVCQKLDAVSLLDLRLQRFAALFDRSSFQNWAGVFTYNEPCIALQLNVGALETSFISLSREDVLAIPGRFIIEAEICHRGPIPISAVTRAHVIRSRTWVAEHTDLEVAYALAVKAENAIRRTQKSSSGSMINVALLDV